MFGFRIVSEAAIEQLIEDVNRDVIQACARVAAAQPCERGMEYARGRDAAAADILTMLDD